MWLLFRDRSLWDRFWLKVMILGDAIRSNRLLFLSLDLVDFIAHLLLEVKEFSQVREADRVLGCIYGLL